MTSIFSIHNHQNKVKQHPLLRLTYLLILVIAIAIPVGSRKVFASSSDVTAQLYIDGQTMNVVSGAKTVKDVIDASGYSVGEKDLVEPSLETEVSDGYKINVYRSVIVNIQDKGANLEIETAQKTAESIVKEAGLSLNPEDTHEIVASDISVGDLKPGITLKVDRADLVNLNLYGAITQQRTQATTVGEFLKEKNLSLQQDDYLTNPEETPIAEGSTFGILNPFREVAIIDEEIPMPEEKLKDVNRDTSFSEVQTPGSPGVRRVTYEIKKENGVEVSRTLVNEIVTKQPVKQVTLVGAKKLSLPNVNVSAQAKQLMAAAGIAESDWGYAYQLIQKESGWNPNATNKSSGACGLVQALPCSKLGPNWNDPVVALSWGNRYVARHGGWAGAWGHSKARGWY